MKDKFEIESLTQNLSSNFIEFNKELLEIIYKSLDSVNKVYSEIENKGVKNVGKHH